MQPNDTNRSDCSHSRDEKKLEVFLQLHRKNLTVADLKIFLPFTINLDPFIKKVINADGS